MVARSLAAELSMYVSDQTSFQIPAGLSPTLLDHIDIQATSSGYLEFSIDDWAIAQWLTCLTQPTTPLFAFADLPACPAKRSHPSLFSIQHAHARCCSLIRLAAQQQIIGLNWQEQPAQWQWAQPDSISWLTPISGLPSEQQFWVSHASERQLINQCLTVFDELPWQGAILPENTQDLSLKPSRITALAQNLAGAFSTMHRHCQIWGSLATEGRDRQTAHLAMILVTQRLLCGLLTGLGVIAPDEL
ncbi:DALR anticodon-binding domain-containing protein [Leptolyngbyaceae cyanobacterium UHCC 1019]